jgi:hypothetical protein
VPFLLVENVSGDSTSKVSPLPTQYKAKGTNNSTIEIDVTKRIEESAQSH